MNLASLREQAKEAAGAWRCNTCTRVNRASAAKCLVCGRAANFKPTAKQLQPGYHIANEGYFTDHANGRPSARMGINNDRPANYFWGEGKDGKIAFWATALFMIVTGVVATVVVSVATGVLTVSDVRCAVADFFRAIAFFFRFVAGLIDGGGELQCGAGADLGEQW